MSVGHFKSSWSGVGSHAPKLLPRWAIRVMQEVGDVVDVDWDQPQVHRGGKEVAWPPEADADGNLLEDGPDWGSTDEDGNDNDDDDDDDDDVSDDDDDDDHGGALSKTGFF